MPRLALPSVLIFSTALSGCGGGGSDGASDSSTEQKQSVGSEQGQFVDSPVSGLAFSTSSGIQGVTDGEGNFTFNPGDTITFDFFSSKLPPVSGKGIVTPNDIAAAAESPGDMALNIARFLQTLDADANPNNGISLPAYQNLEPMDFTLPTSEFENEASVALGRLSNTTQLVSAEQAQAHLDQGLFDVLTDKGRTQKWRIFRIDEDGGESMGLITFQAGSGQSMSGWTIQTFEPFTLVSPSTSPSPETQDFSVEGGHLVAFPPTNNDGQPGVLKQQKLQLLYQGKGTDEDASFDILILGSNLNNLYWLDNLSLSPQAVNAFAVQDSATWFEADDNTFDPAGDAEDRHVERFRFAARSDCNSVPLCGTVALSSGEGGTDTLPWKSVDINAALEEKSLGLIGDSSPVNGITITNSEAGIIETPTGQSKVTEVNHHLQVTQGDEIQLHYDAGYSYAEALGEYLGEGLSENLKLWSPNKPLLENIRDRLDNSFTLDLRNYTAETNDDGCLITTRFDDSEMHYTFGKSCENDDTPYSITYAEESFYPVFQNGPVLNIADLNGSYDCEWDSEDGSSGIGVCRFDFNPETLTLTRYQTRDGIHSNTLTTLFTGK